MEKKRLKFVCPNGSMQEMINKLLAYLAVSPPEFTGVSPADLRGLELGTAQITDFSRFRSQDIPVMLECGAFDFGIVGRDWVVERCSDLVEVANFPLSRSSFRPILMVLVAPKENGYRSVLELPKEATIVTEYPSTADRYLRMAGRADIKIQQSYGQTESKIRAGAASAAIDITETGGSLKANGLAIVETIAESVMTLSANRDSYNDPSKSPAIRKFGDMIRDCYRLLLLGERRI